MTRTDWASANRSRRYPIHDYATANDDSGTVFPENLIADLRMLLTSDDTSPIYLQHYSSNENSVSVTFAQSGKAVATAGCSADDILSQVPVNVVSLTGDKVGMILFGGFTPRLRYKFSGPSQSQLSPHAATVYSTTLAQPRFSREVTVPLTADDITFISQGDLVVSSTYVLTEDGKRRREVSIGLRDTGSAELLLSYANKANADAESLSCGDPQPYYRFGQVRPDCCGRIFLEFRGCVEMTKIDNGCGVVIQCGVKLDDICPQRSEPSVGNLTVDGNVRPSTVPRSAWMREMNLLVNPQDYFDLMPDDDCDGDEIEGTSDQLMG